MRLFEDDNSAHWDCDINAEVAMVGEQLRNVCIEH